LKTYPNIIISNIDYNDSNNLNDLNGYHVYLLCLILNRKQNECLLDDINRYQTARKVLMQGFLLKLKLNYKIMVPYYTNHRHAYPNDSGIDLYAAEDVVIPANSYGIKVPLGIEAELIDLNNGNESPYLLVARSSMAFTPLRLSLPVSVIDKGYRGELSYFVDNLSSNAYNIKKGDRLIQLIAPSLKSMAVLLCNRLTPGTRGDQGTEGLGSSGTTILPKL
jgi:dUTP pyrophosphatase